MTPEPYDPFALAGVADLASTYRSYRDHDPIHRLERFEAWALFRMSDVWSAFSQPDVFSNAGGITASQLLERRIAPFPALANLDRPEHQVRRQRIKGPFGPAALHTVRESMAETCRAGWEPLTDGAAVDVVDVGLQLSVGAVADLLGVPVADRAMLIGLVRDIFVRPATALGITEAGVAAYQQLAQYCIDLVEEQQRTGGSGSPLLASFAEMCDASGQPLDAEALGSHVREVVIGGGETNPKALAAAVARLGADEGQRARVVADPALVTRAFLEALRLDTPGQFIGRTVDHDTTFEGVEMRRGEVVLLVIASANRDEREFDAPDTFDIDRRGGRAVGFGQGIHFCLGRHLAVIESEVALQTLLAVAPRYGVDLDQATVAHHEMVRGFTSLPISVS